MLFYVRYFTVATGLGRFISRSMLGTCQHWNIYTKMETEKMHGENAVTGHYHYTTWELQPL